MKKFSQFLSLTVFVATAPVIAAEEPPDDAIVEQVAQMHGYEELSGMGLTIVERAIGLKWLVQDERLRRSEAAILKYTEKVPFVESIPETERYIEIIELIVRGTPTLYARVMTPEEVQRRKAEGSGLSPELMANALRAYAGGAIATGEALRQEMQNNAFGSLMTRTLGVPMSTGQGMPERINSGADCETWLQALAKSESRGVSGKSGLDLEVKPWTSINPVTFMTGPACMALRTAEVFETIDEMDPETRRQMAQSLEDALAEITLAGREEVNGRPTYRLRIDDANLVESLANLLPGHGDSIAGWNDGATTTTVYDNATTHPYYRRVAAGIDEQAINRAAPAIFYYEKDELSGQAPYQPLVQQVQARGATGAGTVAIHSIDYWIDAEYFVDRKMRMEGVMTENGQSRDVFMEQEFHDYRNVPDSALYEPYRRVMRAGGMLTESQRAELAQAQQQLEEFEQQLAGMPAGQRAMMERMMGGQLEQMRSLVNNGTVEIEVITTNIEINPDFYDPMLADFARQNMSTPSSGDAEKDLLRRIQADLTTLGYEPGNTDGVLDTMTQIAISQFEAEAGLPVTGEPSRAVAMSLAQAVASR